MKSEVSQLKASNGGLVDLYWQLKHGSDAEAWKVVERIRSEDAPDGLMSPSSNGKRRVPTGASEGLGQTEISWRRPVLPSKWDQKASSGDATNTSETAPTASFSDPMNADADSKDVVMGESGNLGLRSERRLQSSECDNDRRLHQSLRSNIDKIREGFAVQCLCISEIFYCYDSDAFEGLVANLVPEQDLQITRATLGEVCAVAATSGKYVRDSIEPGILDYWYGGFAPCLQISDLVAAF